MNKERLRKLKLQGLVFLSLFILAELGLRLYGMKAGSLLDDFEVEDHPVYMPRFYSDEKGIEHISPNNIALMNGTVLNKQGFRGNIEYTRHTVDSLKKYTRRETVMFIGDSYTEGCCADNVKNSFSDLLDRWGDCNALNFGVAGTDPPQYELVAEKYVADLKPDRVVIVLYLGNDILWFKRVITPGVPMTFPFQSNKWLFTTAPNHLSGKTNYVLKTPEEAYDFYRDHYTLKGKNRNVFEKAISYSVIFSKIYLLAEHRLATHRWQKKNPNLHIDGYEITHAYLQGIANTCDSAHVPYLFVGIPMPTEAQEGKKLSEKYAILFKNLSYHIPDDLTRDDYDGATIASHFNNRGHRKFAEFLKTLLKEEQKNDLKKRNK